MEGDSRALKWLDEYIKRSTENEIPMRKHEELQNFVIDSEGTTLEMILNKNGYFNRSIGRNNIISMNS